MASFLPILSEILPMILPASTHIVTAGEVETAESTVEGPVVRRNAVVDRCDKMCASVLTTRPKSTSPIRHNSEQDTIIYAVSGTGLLIVKEGFAEDLRRNKLSAGDFAFIPAWTEHRVQNDTDEDVVWVVMQSGSRPVGAVLTDWGGNEVADESKS